MTTRAAQRAPLSPSILTWPIFPALLAAMIGITWGLLQTDLPRPLASGAALVFTLVAILVLERLFPYHRAWNRRPDPSDVALLVVNRLVDIGVVAVATLALGMLRPVLGPALDLWPTALPISLQVVLGIVIAEAIRYALHRLSHRPGVLWRWHRVHHEPERMYVLNGPRLHPLNYLWVTAAHTVPVILLGAELEVAILIINITGFFVLFRHANLRLRFDGLNQVFATADVHRLTTLAPRRAIRSTGRTTPSC